MVFGHNPGFTNTFNEISDSDIDDLQTCGILGIKFDIKSWNEIYTKKGKGIFLVRGLNQFIFLLEILKVL
jgi:phosphohistidine phosphatase